MARICSVILTLSGLVVSTRVLGEGWSLATEVAQTARHHQMIVFTVLKKKALLKPDVLKEPFYNYNEILLQFVNIIRLFHIGH
jgi:hypothetical protein